MITSLSEFCEIYNPDRQQRYKDAESVFANIDNAATLHDINNAYNENAGATWLIPQIADLSEFCGCKTKISNEQIESLARLIVSSYGDFTIPDFMLFFYRFKKGEYGQFYGNIDPMIITSALSTFRVWRGKKISEIEDEKKRISPWNSREEYEVIAKRQSQYLKSQKPKGIGFTARSDKTNVNPICDIMKDLKK